MTHAEEGAGTPPSIPFTPESSRTFRLAQLLVLFEVADRVDSRVATIDTLAYFDFFAANPFVVVRSTQDKRAKDDRLTLRLAGFSDQQISYASTGQRFASRRQKLQHDLSLLIAYGLVAVTSSGYAISAAGSSLASNLTSVYADAYRDAATIVLRRLGKLSKKKLDEFAREALGTSWLLVDFLADIPEASPIDRGEDDEDE